MDRPRVLDTVEITRDVAGARAGAIGVIVAESPSSALIELACEPKGRSLLEGLVSVPYEALRRR